MREYTPSRFLGMKCLKCGKEIPAKPAYRAKKYCSLACAGAAFSDRQRAAASGRYIDRHGYVIMSKRKDDDGYQQPEHRAVMEQMLGRKLEKHETVHHRNGIRHDNRPENLELWSGRHGRGHRTADVLCAQAGSLVGLLSLSH